MFSIAVIGIFALYLVVSLVIVAVVTSFANKRGKRAWLWGCGAALVMFLIPFWDWFPTVMAHKYYCEKEAGFWVYKTLDQWKEENPGVRFTEDKTTPMRRVGNDENHTDTQVLNQRFRWLTEKRRMTSILSVYEWKREIVDAQNGEVVARHIDFSSGKGRDYLKFWMNIESCPDGIKNRNSLYHFVEILVNSNRGDAK